MISRLKAIVCLCKSRGPQLNRVCNLHTSKLECQCMYIMSNDIVILAYLIRWNCSIGIYSLTVIRFLKKKNNGKLLNYKSTWYATCWIKQLIKIMSQTSAISKAAFDILICRHCYFTVYYSLFYWLQQMIEKPRRGSLFTTPPLLNKGKAKRKPNTNFTNFE